MGKEEKFKNSGIEIGIYTLGDIGPDPHNGKTISSGQRIKEIIQAAKLADEAGLDIFGVGEHHRLDYATSAPPVVLAAIAQITKQIKLTSATTVLSTIDPVRLFEDFATLDLLSDGRAEIIAGRGAFAESFPLFGYDINDYDTLFSEHIDLFLQLNKNERITWNGQFRSSLRNAEIAPRPLQNQIPISIGVGGTPGSAVRAGELGIGMTLVILGGDPMHFKPLVDLYRQTGIEAGHDPENLKVCLTGHGYISKTTQQAKEEFYPYYSNYWSYVNVQRGMTARRISRTDFEQLTNKDTALFVGSPQQIIEKILRQYELFGHQRFMAQIDIGGLPFKKVAEGIELLATEIAPIVRKETSK
ncbi:LLM class flavin-dependent oxidoreductase [Metabacillus fastidiosus]|uniref:LLM class flavin-dependent oxidoreductase n=1 Tax=Metabacillus fastidiosus TaxID=1458 RepID=A0ABU6NZW2_9BACI|nr:LLM class flavin-dependent oxidoreductase [Metabacillus fastidiosus]MED4402268.1 LLM class flavin-dependent oxidoreductase [Metabacillus fastidiosus]MED4462139.1 LLM class flavin-dependent oxidoreductase [Metabacillus fastidiosus]